MQKITNITSLVKGLSCMLLVSFIFSCGTNDSFLVEGTINQASGTIYLQNFRNKMFFVTDSAGIRQGKFRFSGKPGRGDLFGLTTNRDETFQPWFVFLENGKISVSIDTADARSLKVTGSASHDLYESYLSARQDFDIDSFVVAHPSSTVPLYVLYRDFSTRLGPEHLQSIINKIDPELGSHPYYEELKHVIATRAKLATGSEAPDFSGINPEGDEVKLSDFRGRYLLLEFWAAWCGPCRRENPSLVALFGKYHPLGLEILGVSLDRKREDWLKAIEDDSLSWHHVSDLQFWDSAPAKIYGIRHIPANVLIGPDGNILARNLKADALDTILAGIWQNTE